MKLVKWWEAHFFILEFLLSVIIGVFFLLWSEFVDERQFLLSISVADRNSVYGTLASVFGSLLGFNITAVSIVLGYSTSNKLGVIRKSKRYNDLWEVFKSAIRVLGVATVLSLFGLFFDKSGVPNSFILYANVLLAILSFFRVARCVWVLENIILIVTREIE